MWLKLVNKGDSGRKRGRRNKGRGGNKDGGGIATLLCTKTNTFFGFCSERTREMLEGLSREVIAKDLDMVSNRDGHEGMTSWILT